MASKCESMKNDLQALIARGNLLYYAMVDAQRRGVGPLFLNPKCRGHVFTLYPQLQLLLDFPHGWLLWRHSAERSLELLEAPLQLPTWGSVWCWWLEKSTASSPPTEVA